MLLIAKSAWDMQALLHLMNMLAFKVRLRFNPNKCKTLHYSNKGPAGCRNTIFRMGDCDIPVVTDGNPTMFLGKPVGAFVPQDTATIENF